MSGTVTAKPLLSSLGEEKAHATLELRRTAAPCTSKNVELFKV